MRNIYERVIGPARARKHEFVYADGYPVRQGKFIYAVYIKKNKLEVFVDVNEVPVFPRDPRMKTSFGRYRSAKGGLTREVYLKPSQPIITKTMRKNGSIGRSFATYILEDDKSIFEINKDSIGSSDVYHYVSLQWEISGIKENVQKKNTEALEEAEKKLEGMIYFLDPLEFYIEEKNDENGKQTLLERLLHNPHTYTHQSQASNVGRVLGLSGTHTMSDGSVMPGSSHQEYLQSLRENTEITTSSGTTIPTQNLRRNSGY